MRHDRCRANHPVQRARTSVPGDQLAKTNADWSLWGGFHLSGAKLIVEVDGGQHFEAVDSAREARRDGYLAAPGFRVLRFNYLDVMKNKAGVLETIAAALRGPQAPSLTLPRKRRRGQGQAGHPVSSGHEDLQ